MRALAPFIAAISSGALARAYDLAIPAGPLDQGLTSYAVQTGRQILFAPGLVAGKRGNAVTGLVDADRGLSALLAGSGLVARRLRGEVLIIEVRPAPLPAAPPRPPSPAPPDPPPEEIVVTALKRETLLAETAVSMDVLTGRDISGRNIYDLRRMMRSVPGFATIDTGSGQQRLAIRGVFATGEATVGVYYDETPISGPSGTTFDPGQVAPDVELVDVNRVELLRGPQGTLYGASSMGGTLRVLFNQPDASGWHGDVRGGLDFVTRGNTGANFSAVLNAPIVADRLAARVVVYRRTLGGYIDRPNLGLSDTGGITRKGARIALAWTPEPAVHVSLSGLVHRGSADDATYWSTRLGPYRNDQPTRTPTFNTLKLLSGTARWDAAFATLTATASAYRWLVTRDNDYTSVLARQRTNATSCRDYNKLPDDGACTPAQFASFAAYADSRLPGILYQPMLVRSQSGEVRLASPAGATTIWTVGGFVEHRRDRVDSIVLRADPRTGIVITPYDVTGLRTIWTTLSQQALFGELTQPITSRFSLTGGGRYFRYRRSATGDVSQPNILTGTADLAAGPFHTREGGANLKAQLAWHPGHDAIVYAQAAEGFRPGGVNITPNLTEEERSYHADRLWSYELGGRTRLLNGAVGASLAAFHIDWSDMIYATASANGAFAYNTNIGPVNIDGAEAEISTIWAPGGELVLRISYVNARLAADQTSNNPRGLGRKGDRLPNVAHLAASASLSKSVQLARALTGFARADVTAVGASGTQFNPSITYYDRSPAYVLTDVQAGVEHRGWEAAIAVQNLFDKAGAGRALSNTFLSNQVYSVPPRTITLTLARRF
ncbi:TonB-dependent receptor domain-containing protein [Sphingomonas quercus]|uniref:TonB-dependent receptor n=1 Tax=Sphingomonas quercus TaxID=2842451 RepID=A0ABS6BFK4_9SPHN|nr:TonB-dependent receptor [Sphingomonas quercus]MBU3076266.1 TonB-dependent receptor [Sphingomonas quercus]